MNAVKELRNKTSLSQKGFADAFNIPIRTIQQWEQGVSSPPPYVESMLAQTVNKYLINHDDRHFIPPKTSWKICIDEPFENCNRIYPIQQRKVRALKDYITRNKNVIEIVVFGSSTTEKCHVGSDVDIYVNTNTNQNLVSQAHDFEYDLWTNETIDKRLRDEILAKGVKVYG